MAQNVWKNMGTTVQGLNLNSYYISSKQRTKNMGIVNLSYDQTSYLYRQASSFVHQLNKSTERIIVTVLEQFICGNLCRQDACNALESHPPTTHGTAHVQQNMYQTIGDQTLDKAIVVHTGGAVWAVTSLCFKFTPLSLVEEQWHKTSSRV